MELIGKFSYYYTLLCEAILCLFSIAYYKEIFKYDLEKI